MAEFAFDTDEAKRALIKPSTRMLNFEPYAAN